MRFLLDQDVYAVTGRFLTELGHEVVSAAAIGYSQASDSELLDKAHQQGRIFITRDRDFGRLVFVQEIRVGVIYLRMEPTTLSAVHQELEAILASYSEEQLRSAFVVVEPGRHRFRRLS